MLTQKEAKGGMILRAGKGARQSAHYTDKFNVLGRTTSDGSSPADSCSLSKLLLIGWTLSNEALFDQLYHSRQVDRRET
jgi:hypothetical protein